METKISLETLKTLIEEVACFPPTVPPGYLEPTIEEQGVYEEQGLRFVPDDLPLGQLYAGLAVLARDMHHYLSEHPREDAALFEEVVTLVNAVERRDYGAQAFPAYAGLPVETLPQHLASAAALGRPTVTPLGQRDLVHEWTFKPGKRLLVTFLQTFGAAFKEAVCGTGGLYEQLKSKPSQSDTIVAVVLKILDAGFSPEAFWAPLAVVLGTLLVKAGLQTYCEAGD